jgi:hypothetical protein
MGTIQTLCMEYGITVSDFFRYKKAAQMYAMEKVARVVKQCDRGLIRPYDMYESILRIGASVLQ